MLEYLWGFDLYFLHLFNVELASPAMDHFWLSITSIHKQLWFKVALGPALLLLLLYIYRTESVKVILALALAVGLADTLAYRGFKSVVNRQRPFQNEEISWVRKVGQAHGPSFPSNHASNVFAGAVILAWYFVPLTYFLYIFAFFVALSRIALGVHYPTDVVCGMMLGIFVGFLVRISLLNHVRWFRLRDRVSTPDVISSPSRTRSRRT